MRNSGCGLVFFSLTNDFNFENVLATCCCHYFRTRWHYLFTFLLYLNCVRVWSFVRFRWFQESSTVKFVFLERASLSKMLILFSFSSISSSNWRFSFLSSSCLFLLVFFLIYIWIHLISCTRLVVVLFCFSFVLKGGYFRLGWQTTSRKNSD